MELKVDLMNKGKKITLYIVLGILFFVVAIGWLCDHIINDRTFSTTDWILIGVMASNGVLNTMFGFGFSVGKAFININNEIISIKAGVFQKEQKIYWNNIKSVENGLNSLEMSKSDNTITTMNLKNLEYSMVKLVKQTIIEIAKEKGIMVK